MNTFQDLEREIRVLMLNEPLLRGSDIEVVVGVDHILLNGTVNQYRKKQVAKSTANALAFNKPVYEEIRVVLDEFQHNSDPNIMAEIAVRLKINLGFSSDLITVEVSSGFVKLHGQIPWSYQKDLAEDSISDIKGIRNIENLITILPQAEDYLLKTKIMALLTMVAGTKIEVLVAGNQVVLKGIVGTDQEKDTATDVVNKIIGTAILDNQILVASR